MSLIMRVNTSGYLCFCERLSSSEWAQLTLTASSLGRADPQSARAWVPLADEAYSVPVISAGSAIQGGSTSSTPKTEILSVCFSLFLDEDPMTRNLSSLQQPSMHRTGICHRKEKSCNVCHRTETARYIARSLESAFAGFLPLSPWV